MKQYRVIIPNNKGSVVEQYIQAQLISINEFGQILFYSIDGLFAVAPANALVVCIEDQRAAKKIA